MKAQKELHLMLDSVYSDLKKKREQANKQGTPRTFKRKCRSNAGISPSLIKNPHDSLVLDLYEENR